MTKWRISFLCWITKATCIHSEFITLIAFPQQQWLHKRCSMLLCTYTACKSKLRCFTFQLNSIHLYSSRSDIQFPSIVWLTPVLQPRRNPRSGFPLHCLKRQILLTPVINIRLAEEKHFALKGISAASFTYLPPLRITYSTDV
jgi:hypothetical protein